VERDTSPDEKGHIIDDDDNEDSPTDAPDLWMPERNEKDTVFVRATADAIPTQKHPNIYFSLRTLREKRKKYSKKTCFWQG
jgi:hypothetical protein